MNLNKLKVGVVLTSLVFTNQGFSQSSNVVSAALEYQKYEPALAQQDVEKAKGYLLAAKSFIDPAMKNETTKDDAKANYYNVMINYGLIELSTIPDSEDLKVYQSDSVTKVIESSIKKASSKKRWREELEDFFNRRVSMAIMGGEMMFKQKNFEMAFYGFAGAYQIKELAGITEEREAMKTNAIISASRYIDTLEKSGENEKALEFVSSALELFPKSEELAIAGVNLALGKEDLKRAEEYFSVAAEASPNNKVLFSNMGSIYLAQADKRYSEFAKMGITDDGYQEKSNQVEELYGKAEKNLERALQIDPKYAEASYNLGVLYLGRGEKLKNAANQMDFNNPDYNRVLDRSQEMYKKAIAPLETYIEQDPNNASVLNVLFQVHRNAGNTEKALEYKKRAEEVKGE